MIEEENGITSIFQNIFKSENIHPYSRFIDKRPSIAENGIRTVRYLIKKPVFLAGKASWINELTTVIRKYKNTVHYSIKMTPAQAS